MDESSTATPHTTDDFPAQFFPGISVGVPTQGMEDDADDDDDDEEEEEEEGEEVAPVQTLVSTLSTTNEYTGMISQICHTYGVRVLRMPNLTTHINALEQAVREDNRLDLCRSFAKIKTILVVALTSTASEFLDGEYETMVSSTVAEFGVDLLDSTEGVMFMENMGEAMVVGQREHLCTAYANLRAYMVAYAGHTGLD